MRNLTTLFLLIALSIPAFSQTESSVETSDSTYMDTTFQNFDYEDYDYCGTRSKPTIELQYGFLDAFYSREVFLGKLSGSALFELKIGTTSNSQTVQHARLIDHDFKYVFFKIFTPYKIWMGEDEYSLAEDGVRTEIWSFGFGSAGGYGYKLGENSNIVLYNSDDLAWGKIDFIDEFTDSLDKESTGDFGNAIRFGKKFESGIKIQPMGLFSINAGFERQLIYPRHMFWYWTVSEIIHSAGAGGIALFSNLVKNSDYPLATPIVNFVLQTALDWGFYELSRDNMNWPFNTAPPFMLQSWKLGVTFTF